MKNILYPLTMVLVIAVLGITSTGCASPSLQPPATPTLVPPTPTLVPPVPDLTTDSFSTAVTEMVTLMNAGDLEGSLAYFADDAVSYIVGLPPTGMEVYSGKEQIRTLWKDSIDNHFQWEIDITFVQDNIVYVKAKTWHDFTRQIGVAPLEYIDVYEFKDDKIISYSTTITEEALARLKPALAEVMPPEPTTEPSTVTPVSEMTVTIAGGTCTTDITAPLQAGEVKVTLDIKDQNNDKYALTMFNLNQGKDLVDLMMSTSGMPPSWADLLLFEELGPGKSEVHNFTLEKGPVYVVCWSSPPDLSIGNAGPIEVKE